MDLLLHGRAVGWGLYRTPGHNIESADETLASLPAAPVLAALVDLLRSLEPAIEPRVAEPRVAVATPPPRPVLGTDVAPSPDGRA